jgi:all-trans-retinol dehydrogenase (NAD+)
MVSAFDVDQDHDADTANQGLRAELMTRHGTAGHGVCTTSVHPSWHSTGLTVRPPNLLLGTSHTESSQKRAEPTLNAHGIYPDPASNVSNLVVEQVLAGRSGQIFVPKNQERYRNIRGWPLWAQDLLYGYVWKRGGNDGGFRFADDHSIDGAKTGI